MAKALLSARLDGLVSEEKRQRSQKAQEKAVASSLLKLKDAGLQKTQALLKKNPVPKSIFANPADHVFPDSGMKFTRV